MGDLFNEIANMSTPMSVLYFPASCIMHGRWRLLRALQVSIAEGDQGVGFEDPQGALSPFAVSLYFVDIANGWCGR